MVPPRSILAATDFSDASRAAVIFAACLAKHSHATFHLLHAEDPLLAGAARQAGVDLDRETREALQDFIASVPPAGDYAPMHHVVSGPAAELIVAIAEREHADLVVVGSRGMSGIEHLMFGSTTEGVLRRAGTSVLVVPPGWKPTHPEAPDLSGIGPVIAAIDFAAPSIEAAAAACGLAEMLGTGVEAVHVVPDLPVPARWRAHADAVLRQRIDGAAAELAAAVAALASRVHVRERVEAGRVADRLAAIAAWRHARRPMLVLGRRADRRGAAPGAIAYRVLSLAAVPVLMHVSKDVTRGTGPLARTGR
jgi:nucleotide-binding universal stress UspA family protein